MKLGLNLMILTLLSNSLSLWMRGQAPLPDSEHIQVDSDVLYRRAPLAGGGRKSLRMDIYRPADDTDQPHPAIVLMHGGGFFRGSRKSTISRLALELAEQGFVAASISYRLIPDRLPGTSLDPRRRALEAAVEDARAAIDWLRAQAGKYAVDTSRIAVGGSSAGAITALFLAYPGEGEPASGVRAAVSLWGGLYGEEQRIQKGGPPLLIIHGDRDRTVPFPLALAMRERCQEVDLRCEFLRLRGRGHGFAAIPPSTSIQGKRLGRQVGDFLRKSLSH